MASICRKIYYKYTKCLVLTTIILFFLQILLALFWFPSEKGLKYSLALPRQVEDISKRKSNKINNEDNLSQTKDNKISSHLRIEELDFKPSCDITSREAISAIHRSKTQQCKQQIVNKTCLIQNGFFYPKELPNYNIVQTNGYGQYLGCYQDEKKARLLSDFYGNYVISNSPEVCLDICIQGGFSFAGVQYGSECFCGETEPSTYSKIDVSKCEMVCPGDLSKKCGGYFTMNIYKTGLKKFMAKIPETKGNKEFIQIIFLLTLNGRAERQVNRLINALYRTNHYIYIHVDARQDYLYRKLSVLEKKYPNIRLAKTRFSTIWGGASLLKMLLSAMRDIFSLGWQWDYVINLSESDFPIKSIDALETFLSINKGLNFVKSHGREVQRFIKKQGLDKTFIECETHMWRIGDRKLPRGIVVDGGSDWIALSPEFVSYLVGKPDKLLKGLDTIFQHTLLPAESFFHTVLRNSHFSGTYVDNNLHVTNWKRKLGCKCQYKHIVDWCGCSPNDFRTEDWLRIQNTQDRQLFFARKFEPIINQEIITRVEQLIGFNDHYLITNLEGYWQSIYNIEDLTASSDDTVLSHAESILRHNTRILLENECILEPKEIIEISMYNYADVYKGNLILHKTILNNKEYLMETWYKTNNNMALSPGNPYENNVKIFKVSSDYDQKEMTFRNFANILGPFTELILQYQFSPLDENLYGNLTVIWFDPAGIIADIEIIRLEEANLTSFVKPNVKMPLLPGVWKVGLFYDSILIVSSKFLITPIEYISGKEISRQEIDITHSGSQHFYKNYSKYIESDFFPSKQERLILKKKSLSNAKKLGNDLRDWIDSLSLEFYYVLGSCISIPHNEMSDANISCGNRNFEFCEMTKWSSLSPDPKGTIGKLNKNIDRLERV